MTRVFLFTKIAIKIILASTLRSSAPFRYAGSASGRSDNLVGRVLHGVGDDEVISRVRQDFFPSSTLVPSNRNTIGNLMLVLRAASTTPVASVSTRRIPPKMLISTAFTFLSLS